jgi:hypothetical protein
MKTFLNFFGIISYPVNTIFALKPIVKKLLNSEIVIFSYFALFVAFLEKYLSQEFASNKLNEGPLRDHETDFCSPVALTVLEKIFKEFAVFTGFWPKYDLNMKVNVKS